MTRTDYDAWNMPRNKLRELNARVRKHTYLSIGYLIKLSENVYNAKYFSFVYVYVTLEAIKIFESCKNNHFLIMNACINVS